MSNQEMRRISVFLMLLNDLYTILAREQGSSEGLWRFEIDLNPAHPIYQGHFPGHPVTPGACLTEIVMELSAIALNKSGAIQPKSISNLKFLAPHVPFKPICVEISYSRVLGRFTAELSNGVEYYAKMSFVH